MKKRVKARPPRQNLDNLQPPSALLLALESRAVVEWAALALALPWLRNAPAGDGHPVLVLPGLAAGDATTWPLRKFIGSRGYEVYPWELGLNVGPRDGIVRGLADRVREIYKQHRAKISLVGWSLGGAMARAMAVAMPDKIRSVITLGSPHAGHPRGSNAWRVFEMLSGISADDPRLQAHLKRLPRVPMTSILSKTDGVVAWPMSMIPEDKLAENIEVRASHLGLGVNPVVLWAIADRLAQREGEWKPFERQGWHSVFFRDPRRERINDLYTEQG